MEDCSASLLTIASATISGAIVLLGVLISNWANIRRLKIQSDVDLEKEKRLYERSRLEELYILVDDWMTVFFSDHSQLVLVMRGHIDYNKYLDGIIEMGEKNKNKFVRMEMMVEFYFPQLRSNYKKLMESREKHNDVQSAHKQSYLSGDLNGERFVKPLHDAFMLVLSDGEELKKKIPSIIHT